MNLPANRTTVYQDAARREIRDSGSVAEARFQVARTLDLYGADRQSRDYWRAVQQELKRIAGDKS